MLKFDKFSQSDYRTALFSMRSNIDILTQNGQIRVQSIESKPKWDENPGPFTI